MATLNTSRGSSTSDVTMEDRAGVQPAYGQQPIGPEAKRAAVHEEMRRMTKLPATSTYASHRLRVLNKILQLLSIQCRKSKPRISAWLDKGGFTSCTQCREDL